MVSTQQKSKTAGLVADTVIVIIELGFQRKQGVVVVEVL